MIAAALLSLRPCRVRAATPAGPATRPAATQPATLPHLDIDVKNKRVRIECQAVNAPAPLEYFLCAAGGAEHETVLRTHARASNVHLGLLMIGLEPGFPLRRAVAGGQKLLPPDGPALRITCEFIRNGQQVTVPAERMMRRIKDNRPLDPVRWVFCGSHLERDGRYAADVTGQFITVVNFQFSVIDIAELRSSANETLEWEINPDVVPDRNAAVWVVVEPAPAPGGK